MAAKPQSGILAQLRRAALRQGGGGLSDGQLLECFLAWRDEVAFEALVRRHGPMVLSVCRRVLGNVHDADDAFQATFLVLVRKAASILPPDRVGNWLYGVAYRTALEAKSSLWRRRMRERPVAEMPEPAAPAEAAGQDVRPLVDQELDRLPEKYRTPVVLCDLEERGRKEVARQLAIPEGTLSSRLATGRGLLAKRLARRGLTLSLSALATALSSQAASAAVPAPLVTSTVKAAQFMAAGGAAKAVVSTSVAALIQGVLRAMLLTKIKIVAVICLMMVFGVAAGVLMLPRSDAGAAARPVTAAVPADGHVQPSKEPESKEADTLQKLYALRPDEVLKYVPPPFSPARMAYYVKEHAHQAQAIPSGPQVMMFRWENGKLSNWGMTFCGPDDGQKLSGLAQSILGIYPQEIEGDAELLKKSLQGDFIFRPDAGPEKILRRLEEIYREHLKLPVKLTFREVDRKVTVASGRYELKPLAGRGPNDIDIYGKQLVENSGAGGGSGNFAEFLGWVGMFIDRRIVSDVQAPPPGRNFSWRYHRRSPFTDQERREDTDPELVLKHVSEQTGLFFKEETRRVRVLFVERGDGTGERKAN